MVLRPPAYLIGSESVTIPWKRSASAHAFVAASWAKNIALQKKVVLWSCARVEERRGRRGTERENARVRECESKWKGNVHTGVEQSEWVERYRVWRGGAKVGSETRS